MQEYVINKVNLGYEGLDDAFPTVDPNCVPCGSNIVIQLKRSKSTTAGGIILVGDSKQTEQWNTQVAKVVCVGPLAYKNRDTMTQWPEGAWVKEGDFVRVPKYGGDRWTVSIGNGEDDEIHFIMFNDLDVRAIVPNPLSMKAYI